MTRVLVVDDNAPLAELLREALQDEGYCVRTASDAAEAYTSIVGCWPDVMLLDVQLPGLDGWTFLGACRQHPWAARLPVIMLSAPREGPPAVDPRVAFLPKPFDLDLLVRTVARLVAARRPALGELDPARRAEGISIRPSSPRGHATAPARWDRAGAPVLLRPVLGPGAVLG